MEQKKEKDIREEQEKFIYHINEIENLSCSYTIEDMGNESLYYVYRRPL